MPAAGAQPDATQGCRGCGLWVRARRGGFCSREGVDPLEMWPERECAAQRRAAQRAGVGDVGA